VSDVSRASVLVLGVGAARGLGAATARVFAAAGHPVVIAGRSAEKLREAAESVVAVGGTVRVEVGDVTNAADVIRFVASAEALAPLHVAIQNAGGNRPSPFLKVTPESFEEHWRSHAFAGFLLGQAALPSMLRRTAGTIIFTGATGSLRGSTHFSPFAAAKAALRMIAQSLAREFGPQGIHVEHVVIDGVIEGDRVLSRDPAVAERFGPDGMLNPDKIAAVYLMLHSQHRSAWTHELDVRPWSEKF
jgi:NAD(P)-dependent dehydrogenase (short-subunit alcohol dehydrogenase family)